MANNFYGATSLIGGATGALDKIDGADLANKDAALVVTATKVYAYFLDATSGAAESSPDVVKPDTSAGTKRWILKKAVMDYGDISGNDSATDVTGAELEALTDAGETSLHSHAEGGTTDDHSAISDNDGATDVTGAELEDLSDGGETSLHSHAESGTTDDHADISDNDAATDVTGTELEALTDGGETALHSHAAAGAGPTTDDHSAISDNDGATDVTGTELEALTDGGETALHSHAAAPGGETFVDRGDTASSQDWGLGAGITDDSTWRELDMSAVVPAGAANKLVMLFIEVKSVSIGRKFQLRTLGNSNTKNIVQIEGIVANEPFYAPNVLVKCDGDRKIEYYSADLTTALVLVRGWWE